MRMGFLLIAALICIPVIASAQMIEITPMIGYEWAGTAKGDDEDLDLGSAENYAVIVGYQFLPNAIVEFNYSRMPTTVSVEPSGLPSYKLTDAKINYFLLGVTQQFLPGKFKPFVNGSIGATLFSPEASGYDDEWRFTFALGGGAKIFFIDERLGVRLQGRLILPITLEGVWFGTGGIGVGGAAIFQGDLSAGIVIGIGKSPQEKGGQ
jgi:hypothetical protein